MDDAYTQERLNKIQFLQDTTKDERFTYKTEFNYLTKDQVKLAWKIIQNGCNMQQFYFLILFR